MGYLPQMMLAMKHKHFGKERFADGSTDYFVPIKKLNIDTGLSQYESGGTFFVGFIIEFWKN